MADETKLTAATRLEKLLDNIAGGENEVTPATRLEKFLSYIADAMEGGGGESEGFLTVIITKNEDDSYSCNKTYNEILQHFNAGSYMLDVPVIGILNSFAQIEIMKISFDLIGDNVLLFSYTYTGVRNAVTKELTATYLTLQMDSNNNITERSSGTVIGTLN